MSKPTLIFVPGVWHAPEVFKTLINKPSTQRHRCIPVSLSAAGQEPAVSDVQSDINTVHRIVHGEVNQGHDVAVVAHSCGGIVAGRALDGLGKTERENDGLRGGWRSWLIYAHLSHQKE
jgi:hypothetical protein